MGRSQGRTETPKARRGPKPRARVVKSVPLLQAVWEQVAGEVLSAPQAPRVATGGAVGSASESQAIDGTTFAEDSLDAAGVDLWGPVAVAALGDARDTDRQLRVLGDRIPGIGAVVLDVRGMRCGGPEWACALLTAWARYRELGRECLIAAGTSAERVRALPGIAGSLVFGTVEEAVWSALQIAGD